MASKTIRAKKPSLFEKLERGLREAAKEGAFGAKAQAAAKKAAKKKKKARRSD